MLFCTILFAFFIRFFGIDKTIKEQISLVPENRARAETINLARDVVKALQIYAIEKDGYGQFVFPSDLSDFIISLNKAAELENLLTKSDVETITAASMCKSHCPRVLFIDHKDKKTYKRPSDTMNNIPLS